ncbi:hypothetical protein B0O99DRAFT_505445 [Bisporella sp. PMI_857]|nr:hypothetical protein B0O99DRAFT_505445 [Bisporella sp. PMI_857]
MSEYWKSTPKYWCKHCKIFIRDTKLEKTNHEATPKHQGNIKRFLRDLHRGHEKDEREQQRAKNEVARLNGMVAGGSLGSGTSSAGQSTVSGVSSAYKLPKPPATAEQIKKQREQLAALGVAVPDEFRPDLAMTGDWQVVSERLVKPEGEKKPDAIALGVRKREDRSQDEEEWEAKKMRYGSRFKTYPAEEDEADLDALLNNVTGKGNGVLKTNDEWRIKTESKDEGFAEVKEDSKLEPLAAPLNEEIMPPMDAAVKDEAVEQKGLPAIVFKKRKAQNIRKK